MSRYSNQAICERDWIDLRGVFDGDRLVSLQSPVRLVDSDIARCAWCGGPTILGAYVRVETASVPYPTQETTP